MQRGVLSRQGNAVTTVRICCVRSSGKNSCNTTCIVVWMASKEKILLFYMYISKGRKLKCHKARRIHPKAKDQTRGTTDHCIAVLKCQSGVTRSKAALNV